MDSQGHHIRDELARIWNVALGYYHQALVETAARQTRKLISCDHHFGMGTTHSIELAEQLVRISPACSMQLPTNSASRGSLGFPA